MFAAAAVRPAFEAAKPVVLASCQFIGGTVLVAATTYVGFRLAVVTIDQIDAAFDGIGEWREKRRIAAEKRKADKAAKRQAELEEAAARKHRQFVADADREMARQGYEPVPAAEPVASPA